MQAQGHTVNATVEGSPAMDFLEPKSSRLRQWEKAQQRQPGCMRNLAHKCVSFVVVVFLASGDKGNHMQARHMTSIFSPGRFARRADKKQKQRTKELINVKCNTRTLQMHYSQAREW
jgi:hypothetical protein